LLQKDELSLENFASFLANKEFLSPQGEQFTLPEYFDIFSALFLRTPLLPFLSFACSKP